MINTGRVIIMVINDNIISEVLLTVFCQGAKLLIRNERLLASFTVLQGFFTEAVGFKQMIFWAKTRV